MDGNWVSLGKCDCCGPAYPYYYYGSSGGIPTPETCCDQLNFITITSADNPIAYWFTQQGFVLPHTFANPIDFSSVELCGGDIGSFGMEFACIGSTICGQMVTSGPGGYLLADDCTTKLFDQCISTCSPCATPPGSTGTLEISNYVCAADGFVSADFVFHTSQGDIHGTVSR